MLFTLFSVPAILQHRLLFWGVLGALVMRGGMIWLGTEMLHQHDMDRLCFRWFALITGLEDVDLQTQRDDQPEGS